MEGNENTIEGSRHLRINAPGAEWLHASNQTLFVRECYPALFKLMTGEDAASWPLGEGVVLYGQPGIGKSVLGDYLLHEFLRAGWLVFAVPDALNDDLYMFKDGVVYYNEADVSANRFISNIDRMYTCNELGTKKVVIILDSSFTGKMRVPVICISSAERIHVLLARLQQAPGPHAFSSGDEGNAESGIQR
jgi:hypothetical protein